MKPPYYPGICKCGHPCHGHEDDTWLGEGFEDSRGRCEVEGCSCLTYVNESYMPPPQTEEQEAFNRIFKASADRFFGFSNLRSPLFERLRSFEPAKMDGGKRIREPFIYGNK